MDLSVPRVMGILNVTPNSFVPESRATTLDQVLARAKCLFDEGADLLDLGAESTAPTAGAIDEAEEQARLIPAIEAVRAAFPERLLSADTYHTSTARAALAAGADIINDVCGTCPQPGMVELIAQSGAGYVLMHSRGIPMSQDTNYEPDVVAEVLREIIRARKTLLDAGCAAEQIIIDPGIGFSKTEVQSQELLMMITCFTSTAPVLIGLSHKRVVRSMLEMPTPEGIIEKSIELATFAAIQGASILRVHEVAPMVAALKKLNQELEVAHG